ncbi:MAG: tetratricopeptide repeat protein, partial [Micropepsaceae bacterium]
MNLFARLALAAIVAASVPFAAHTIIAQAEQTATAPRTEGEDLYRRGLYAEALAWWTERAGTGDVESARRLGVEYMDGKRGVIDRDFEKARKYHLQAAMGGERRSMMDLGTIYDNGYGVPENLIEAARWYGWSAKYGHGPAMYNTGLMLETGDGGRTDLVEAYMWYVLGAREGFKMLPETKFDIMKPPPDSAMGALHIKL